MFSWRTRMRLWYILLFLIVLGAFIGGTVAFFNNRSSCSDGTQNGDELGVDCGGSCKLVCPTTIREPLVLWSRALPISDGIYHAVAYVENKNDAIVDNAGYLFQVYDSSNTLVAERRGRVDIPASKQFSVFEGNIRIDAPAPFRTFFEFSDDLVWTQNEFKPTLLASGILLEELASSPRLEVTIENPTVYDVRELVAHVLLLDFEGNAVGVSRSVINDLKAGESLVRTFTWPRPFSEQPVRTVVEISVVDFN